MRIIVVGGSLGGLTAGLLLRDQGHDVTILERSTSELEGRGAGIVLHPSTIRYLTERCGVGLPDLSIRAESLRYLDSSGSVAAESPISLHFASYTNLYSALLERFGRDDYRLDSEVLGIEQSHDDVRVTLRDGTSQSADLLVCADGARSRSRRLIVRDSVREYAGYVAWRGTMPLDELSTEAGSQLRDAITYHVLGNGHILTYPIPATMQDSSGAQSLVLNWLWYRNASPSELPDLLLDATGVQREISVPEALVRDEHLDALRRDAVTLLPPSLSELVSATQTPYIQVISDVDVDRMAKGRVCLVGDAAFVVRPHVAVGTAKAAEDAWQLSSALDGATAAEVPARLLHWEQGQLALGRSLLARARHAGRRSQFENTWQVGESLPFGLHRIGDSHIEAPRETAVT